MKGESNCCLKKNRKKGKKGVSVVLRNSLAREQPVAAGSRGCSWFPRLGCDLRADGARPQLGFCSHVAACLSCDLHQWHRPGTCDPRSSRGHSCTSRDPRALCPWLPAARCACAARAPHREPSARERAQERRAARPGPCAQNRSRGSPFPVPSGTQAPVLLQTELLLRTGRPSCVSSATKDDLLALAVRSTCHQGLCKAGEALKCGL